MAEYVQNQDVQNVPFGQNLLLIDSTPCPCGLVNHRNGSGVFTLRGGRTYRVTFNGNIAIPTGGTVAAIAVSLAINGEPLQRSRAIVTPGAVEQYFNVTSTADIQVPCGCCYTVALENVNAGVNGQIVDEQTISFADGNLVIEVTGGRR